MPSPKKQTFIGEAIVFDDDYDHGRRAAETAVGRAFMSAEMAYRGGPWTVVGIQVSVTKVRANGADTPAYTATLTAQAGD